jgi:hypothetical protein
MRNPKIVVYNYPNPEIKSFITTFEISSPRVEHFKKPLDKDSEDTLWQLGIIGAQIVKEIMSIPGVKEIHIKPKEIRMKKEISSSWEDIEKQVITILNRAFRKKQIKVIKG